MNLANKFTRVLIWTIMAHTLCKTNYIRSSLTTGNLKDNAQMLVCTNHTHTSKFLLCSLSKHCLVIHITLLNRLMYSFQPFEIAHSYKMHSFYMLVHSFVYTWFLIGDSVATRIQTASCFVLAWIWLLGIWHFFLLCTQL